MLGRRRLGAIAAAMLLTAARSPVPRETGSFLGAGWDNATALSSEIGANGGSMYVIAQEVTGAAEFWNDGITGQGVDIALIDTGVAPVPALDGTGGLANGPDLSVDQVFPNLATLDAFGHGTHLAGIAAGRVGGLGNLQKGDQNRFLGMAPGARVVNVKVGDRNGVVDVSQVIAAIDWVVANRASGGRNIEVLLLAYGTDGSQPSGLDPLADAVERAWEAGITVVVAAGNDGNAAPLRNPATDPFVIAVGATDSGTTYDAIDDTIPSFSSCGTLVRSPDVVAPGQSVISLRVPGSVADTEYPEARVGTEFFVGSGTSQAAAVVAGAAALIADQRPGISPDAIKALLMNTAQHIPGASDLCQGAGLIDLKVARDTATPDATQSHLTSNGSGTLDGARGSHHVTFVGRTLVGETTMSEWEPFLAWTKAVELWLAGDHDLEDALEDHFGEGISEDLEELLSSWGGNSWGGNSWGGNSWGGNSWGGNSWGGNSWGGNSWGGNSWGSNSWS